MALAIANEVPGVRVFGTDISLTAMRVARENAAALRLRATFVEGDLFGGLPEELEGRVDVITLHPPYVARDELRELPEEIRRFEPVHTLSDRSLDGLGLVGRAASEGPRWLKPRRLAADRGQSGSFALGGIRVAAERFRGRPEHDGPGVQGDPRARRPLAGLSEPSSQMSAPNPIRVRSKGVRGAGA